MGSNWKTLSSAEWKYLLDTRSASTVNGTANARYAKATVCSNAGLIIFPDEYTHPSGVTAPTSINTTSAEFTVNTYDASAWSQMEAAGIVFLPAAGFRIGSYVYYVGDSGIYWSSTPLDSDYAYYLDFNSSNVYPADYDYRDSGYSVRLVTE